MTTSPSRSPLRRTLVATASAAGLLIATAIVAVAPPARPAAATSASPTACTRVINGVEWNLDPCIGPDDPVPPDFQNTLDDLATCPTASPSPSATTAGRVAPAADPGARVAPAVGPAAGPATATTAPFSSPPVTSPPVSSPPVSSPPSSSPPVSSPPVSSPPASPTGSPTASPTVSPTGSPTPSPSGTDDPQCPVIGDPVPWPGYPPPTPPDPSASPTPTPSITPTPTDTPTPPTCDAGTSGAQPAAEPLDEKADLIHCRKPADPKDPITLVAVGNSLVSAHHQTGFGIGKCDNTASDARKLTGNDADFSFVGRYYAANKQIAEYYNFARTGFGTDDIVGAPAAKTDGCGNLWNRNDTPINLAVKVVKAAKAKGNKAYFVADGGVNNTNWTDVLSALAQCTGLDFAVNNLLAGAGNVGVKVKFYYVVPKVDATDPPLGLKKNIISKGGACYGTVSIGGPFPQTWWTRIGVPGYDGPGSLNPSARSARIKGDITASINAMLGAGADKIVWMRYYNINPANVDIANFGLAAAKSWFPAGISKYLPNTVTALDQPLVEAAFAGDVNKMTADLNAVVDAAIPVNPKVKGMTPPALGAADIQNTAIGGSPHPNDSGHAKLATTLSTTYAGM